MTSEQWDEVWAVVRSALEWGAAIGRDYDNGHYQGYEGYSAKLDAKARVLTDKLEGVLKGEASDAAGGD